MVLSMALFFGSVVNAQVGSENGIHVSGGSSSQSKISSNIGNSTTATGYNSFASGYASEASGHTSTALGREAKALGAYSMALGNFVTASANNSFVIGTGFSSTLPLTNSAAGIMMGVNSQQPTLTITAAASANRTGKITIGNVTTPLAKLHIAGDGVENADILLASTGTNKSIIQFRNSDNNITVGSDNVMKFNAPNMQFYPTGQVAVNGAFKATGNVTLSGLAGSSSKVLTVGTNGQLSSVEYSTFYDDLGNHTAEQNINLNGKKIVNGTSGTGGIFVSTGGKVRIGTGTTAPTNALEVNGTTVSTNLKISGLASSTQKVLTVGTGGQVSSTDVSTFADNMGDHIATQNIDLHNNWIVNGASGLGGIFVSTTGNVGINTELPQQKLHVKDGNILISRLSNRPPGSTNGSLLFGDTITTAHPFGRWGIEYLDQDGVRGLNFWKTSDNIGGPLNYVLFLCSEENDTLKGNVGIGTGNPKEKLTVNGRILAREVIVSNDIRTWPDYVFAPGYEMMSLTDLEAYVNEHHHLPDVPSAEEVEERGIGLGEMNAILLQKVEEMTLRMIEMEKRIQELESQSIENNQ